MLGMVSDVSATLVATTHSLQPSGGGAKTYRKERKINTYHYINVCSCASNGAILHVYFSSLYMHLHSGNYYVELTLACFSVDNRENNGSTYNGSVHTCLL